MSDARQVGLGLLMYVQDYDERYPSPDHFSGGAVGPYIKNESVFEGFNYVYPGESITQVTKPAETAMGYIVGPGGRAVVYVDGHVMWEPDRK
jgi:prepilin-type processing-associated H-X9-DG protein